MGRGLCWASHPTLAVSIIPQFLGLYPLHTFCAVEGKIYPKSDGKMDLVTAIGLVLALVGVGLTLVFVVWQPKHPLLRGIIGLVGIAAIIGAIIVLVGFAPIQWRSPIVLRSPIAEQNASASISPVATPKSIPTVVVQAEPCRDEALLRSKLASAERQIASQQETADILARCEDAKRELEHQKQTCTDYQQKVVGDIGYLLDRSYIEDLLTAKGEVDAAESDTNAAGEESNSHSFNQAPYLEKYNRAVEKKRAAEDKLADIQRALENTLLKLAGRNALVR